MDRLCSICLENYSTEKPPIELSICKHIFHEKCINDWNTACAESNLQSQCPECKAIFKKTDMKFRQDILQLIIKKMLQIQCKIHLPDEKTIEIPINNSRTVSDLCKIVEIYSQIPIVDHIYNYNGKQFSYEKDSTKMLSNYGLTEGAILKMTQKQKLFQILLQKLDGGGTVSLQVSSEMLLDKFYDLVEYTTQIPKSQSRFQAGTKAFSTQSHNKKITIGDMNIYANQTIYQLARMRGGNE